MPKPTFNQLPHFSDLEEQVIDFWRDINAFDRSVQMRDEEKSFVFYDGPPFATGMPHYGHLLGSTAKDVIGRYWTMKGYRVERVWGWDCHGLPIENMIEKQLGIKTGKKGIEDLGVDKFNQACRSEVMRLDSEWEKIIERLGRWVDFEHNYKTMNKTFMESVWWGFKQLFDKGLVYQGKKVILYCPRCATPLSNFEIAMDNSYQTVNETATTYKYPVKGEDQTFLLAWSTTPWNKLATPALAVNPDLKYVKVKQGDEYYILAASTLEMLTDEDYQILAEMTGSDLTKLEFTPHYDFYPNREESEKFGVIIADDFVSADEGTGIVTLAVYGEDDFRVMKEHGVQLIEHVDEEGKLKPEVEPFAGQSINQVNPAVNADLAERGLIYQDVPYSHSVAHCYRCSTRLYYAPLPAWFIDVQQLKPELIKQNETINWVPTHLKHGRFGKGLETAPDWNISRSRYWGTPMPIWRGEQDGQEVYRVIGSVAELQKWAVDSQKVSDLPDIHPEFLTDIEVWVDDDKTIKGTRVSEVFDCWVESGSMPFAAIHYPFANKQKFEDNYPAQFVSEYIAQTRAWFYTMHVISVGIFGKAAFENVLTTGTIMAEDGTKMSKSKKNFPDPLNLINQYGVDSLRLYLMSSSVMKSENINFSEKEVADIRKNVFVIWWNMLSFYVKVAGGQPVNPGQVPAVTDVMDRWVISRLASLSSQVTAELDSYDVVTASRRLMAFVNELSTWYLRRSRDRLKAEDGDASRQTLGFALYTLAQLMAPIAPFFPEVVHHTLVDEQTSIHHTDWPNLDSSLVDPQLEEDMNLVRQLVEKILAERATHQLKVRQPLAEVEIRSEFQPLSPELTAVLLEEVNIKDVKWTKAEQLSVELDTVLTPELQAEGEARELIRAVQNLRKKSGAKADDWVKITAPNWPEDYQTRLLEATRAKSISPGDKLEIQILQE